MILKDSFYTVLSKHEFDDAIVYSIKLNADHEIYKGHFPGNPVTPGVVQMEIIKELVTDILGKPIQLVKMPSCKFVALLNPEINAEIDVELKITEAEEGQYRAIAVIQKGEMVFLKLSVYYALL